MVYANSLRSTQSSAQCLIHKSRAEHVKTFGRKKNVDISLSLYLQGEDLIRALEIFRDMQMRGMKPNITTWCYLINSLSKNSRRKGWPYAKKAYLLWRELEEEQGIKADIDSSYYATGHPPICLQRVLYQNFIHSSPRWQSERMILFEFLQFCHEFCLIGMFSLKKGRTKSKIETSTLIICCFESCSVG